MMSQAIKSFFCQKQVWQGALGNLLEWYDFGLFSCYADLFARNFFSNKQHSLALLEVFATFAIGFLMRPIGSIFFGYIGDKLGRVKLLQYSILLMTIPTILMIFLPGVAQIGPTATVLFVLLRMLQGLSLGGEYSGTITYLVEMAPDRHRGLVTSLACTIANAGILLATLVVVLINHHMTGLQADGWGWRIGFVFGGLFGICLFLSRTGMSEPVIFSQNQAEIKQNIPPIELGKLVKRSLKVISLAMMGSVFYYTFIVYLFQLLRQNHHVVDPEHWQTIVLLSMLFLVPVGGYLCDYFGRRRSFLFISGALFCSIGPCLFALLSGKLIWIGLSLAWLSVLSSFEQATTSITVAELFATWVRARGLSISYNITQAVFAGTAPLIAQTLVLVTHIQQAPIGYMMLIALITFISSWFLPKKDSCSLAVIDQEWHMKIG